MKKISNRPFNQKEWDSKMAKAREEFGTKELVKDTYIEITYNTYIEITYRCNRCLEIFYYDDPCPETEQNRQRNLKTVERDVLDTDPKILKANLWTIAKRLVNVDHLKYANTK